MTDMLKHTLRLASLALFLILAACSGAPKSPVSTVSGDGLIDSIEAIPDILARAQAYQNRASAEKSPLRDLHYLRAAEILYDEVYPELGNSALAQADNSVLEQVAPLRLQIIRAYHLLAEQKAQQAIDALPDMTGLSLPNQIRAYRIKARAHHRLSQPVEELSTRIEMDKILSDSTHIWMNEQKIWANLLMLPTSYLAQELASSHDISVLGWLELAFIYRDNELRPRALKTMLDNWKQRYASHPANREFVATLLAEQASAMRMPDHIALILPLSGPYAAVGKALRDGFLAAYYQSDLENKPKLVFYDSQNSADSWRLYKDAVDNGAGYIIGPFNKDMVSKLAESSSLPVPTLALNAVSTVYQTPPENLYQFALLPEDEASQIADLVIAQGHGTAITSVPNSTWGQRLQDAFVERYRSLGGEVVYSARYNPGSNDHSASIKQMLEIDRSEARKNTLVATLGQKVEFEPRPRADVEAVFIAATPEQARSIMPQLKFHGVGDLPTYATSHVFSGAPNRKQDADLNGLMYCDIPWILSQSSSPLRQQIDLLWPDSSKTLIRLYALGADAFRLIPHLDRLQDNGAATFNGATGRLSLDENRRIHRALDWGTFRRGEPRHTEYQMPGDTEDDVEEKSVNAIPSDF